MRQLTDGGVLTRQYVYNGRGERVAKRNPTIPAGDVLYVYDETGRLLGEYEIGGARIKEYVWLDDTLVAVLSSHGGSSHQYVLTDHLGTPRAVVHPGTNAIVWRWDLTGSAFGDHAANEDPDGDTIAYVFNLRYPGQYFDEETGLHYNYFRDYEPSTGRYVQSDPIGLGGGPSTYTYANSNTLAFVDPMGLTAGAVVWQAAPSQLPAVNWGAVRTVAGRAGPVGLAASGGWLLGSGINGGYEWLRGGNSIGSDVHGMLNPNSGWAAATDGGFWTNDPVAQRERLDYKHLSSLPPPNDSNECQRLLFKIARDRAVAALMIAWDTKWQSGGTHRRAITQRMDGVQSAVKEYELKCGKCPL